MTTTLARGNGRAPARDLPAPETSNYRWVALATVTLGTLMVFINQSIVLISLPDIFRGIDLNPLTPGNTGYLLWMLMGFMVVWRCWWSASAVWATCSAGCKMYNLGFAVFTVFSILLSVTWMPGRGRASGSSPCASARAWAAPALRQLLGHHDRRLPGRPARPGALASTRSRPSPAPSSGSCSAACWRPVEWHLVFLVSVPVGHRRHRLGLRQLEDRGVRTPAKIDWLGNITFAVGLIAFLVGITYGLCPTAATPWGGPAPSCWPRSSAAWPCSASSGWSRRRWPSRCSTCRCSASAPSAAGNVASFLAALSRGGLMFMLIIWLQGIWLPAARLQLRPDAPVGRHLHDPADRRLPGRGPGQRAAGGPLRCPSLRHRRWCWRR